MMSHRLRLVRCHPKTNRRRFRAAEYHRVWPRSVWPRSVWPRSVWPRPNVWPRCVDCMWNFPSCCSPVADFLGRRAS